MFSNKQSLLSLVVTVDLCGTLIIWFIALQGEVVTDVSDRS